MELADFLTKQCEDKGISLRSLSVNAGLSSGTVHNIVKNKSKPRVSSLNALADYLGVKREYLCQMTGLVKDNSYSPEIFNFSDPNLELLCARVSRLSKKKREIVISVIRVLLGNL